MPNYMVDFASTEIDDQCPRKYWNTALEGGVGITRRDEVVLNAIREETYRDLAAVAEMEDVNPIHIQAAIDDVLSGITVAHLKDVQKMEILYRRLGWLAAFAMFIEPDIRRNYLTMEIDSEIILDRTPLWTVIKPSRLLKSKKNGELLYREYVPMPPGLGNKKWLESWEKNMRLHLGVTAASETLKQEVKFGQVMGLYEGFVSTLDARLVHPYVWGWYNKEKDSWTNSYQGKDGKWEKRPVWEFPGGIVAWVRMCGDDVARTVFTFSTKVTPNKEMVTAWASRRTNREREINNYHSQCHANHHLRDVHFPYRTNQCVPLEGKQCAFVNVCWDKELRGSACKTGEFVPNLINSQELKVGEVVS